MQSLESRSIAVSGFCSTGKSELARQIGTRIGESQTGIPVVIHMGDMFRFCHDFGVKIGEGPEAIAASAQLALEQVQLVVDHTTGEMTLKPKNGDTFAQSGSNGVGASSLGSNGDLALFAKDFIWDAVAKLEQPNTILVIDGREQMLEWFTPHASSRAVLVRTQAALPVRTSLYRQEREEAREYLDEQIHAILRNRDQKDMAVLTHTLVQTRHVIDVERTDPGVDATARVAGTVTGIIFQHFDGHPPSEFATRPVAVSDAF